MRLKPGLNKIKVDAVWWKYDNLKEMTLEEAMIELKNRSAKVISPDTILLTKKKNPIKMRVLQRDNYTCYFCGEYGDTLEHLQPTSRGGKTDMNNCVCACDTCNSHKGDMTESEYWKYLKDVFLWEKKEKEMLKEIFSLSDENTKYRTNHKEICKCGNPITKDCFYDDLCLDCEKKIFGKR